MFELEYKDGEEIVQVGNANYQVMAEYKIRNGWKRHFIGKRPRGKQAYEIWISKNDKTKILPLGVNF